MTIRVLAQRNALAAQYATAAPNGTIFKAFARKAIGGNWASATASASAVTGSATFGEPPVTSPVAAPDVPDVAAGTTVTFAGVCVSAVAGTADVRDSVAVTSQAFASQGTYQVTFTYTQT